MGKEVLQPLKFTLLREDQPVFNQFSAFKNLPLLNVTVSHTYCGSARDRLFAVGHIVLHQVHK